MPDMGRMLRCLRLWAGLLLGHAIANMPDGPNRPLTYAEKLRDPRWQRRRLEIMQRDGFKCRDCQDAGRTLNVHHLAYVKGWEPWDYGDEYLMTLCEKCHEDMENIKIFLCLAMADPHKLERMLRIAESTDHCGMCGTLLLEGEIEGINAADDTPLCAHCCLKAELRNDRWNDLDFPDKVGGLS